MARVMNGVKKARRTTMEPLASGVYDSLLMLTVEEPIAGGRQRPLLGSRSRREGFSDQNPDSGCPGTAAARQT